MHFIDLLRRPGHHLWIAISALLLLGSLASAQVERISLADDGSEANAGSYRAAISGDGSVIVFQSNADNLVAGDTNGWVDVFVRDLGAGSTEMAHLQPDGGKTQNYSKTGSISGDGSLVTQILTCSSRRVSNRSRESLRNLGNR